MPSVALPAPAVLMECLCEAQLAAVVSTEAVGRALGGICGSVPRRIVPVRAELASVFWVQVPVSVLPRPLVSCVPLCLTTGINRRGQGAEGKGDFPDVRQSLTIQRFNDLTDQVPSVRGLSPPAIDSRIEVSAWTFFIRT